MQLTILDKIKNADSNIGQIIELARGGQKVVYLTEHKVLGKPVLKVILNARANVRAEREIEIATTFDFTNVPKLYSWGEIEHNNDRVIYLLEQFIEGETLRNRLDRDGRLSIKIGVEIIKNLLETAVQLETHNLVHRDIKPENIMIGTDNSFWLLDFGIARYLGQTSLTATSDRFGPHTPGYAAPEQYRNIKNDIDIRSDLFSIGVVAYEMLTGTHPFRSINSDFLEIVNRIENTKPIPPQIIGDRNMGLSNFILILINKYLSRRPRNAQQALDWLNTVVPTI